MHIDLSLLNIRLSSFQTTVCPLLSHSTAMSKIGHQISPYLSVSNGKLWFLHHQQTRTPLVSPSFGGSTCLNPNQFQIQWYFIYGTCQGIPKTDGDTEAFWTIESFSKKSSLHLAMVTSSGQLLPQQQNAIITCPRHQNIICLRSMIDDKSII